MAVPTNSHGWPYLTPNNEYLEVPAYTKALADKLETSDAQAAANAAAQASTSAQQAAAAAAKLSRHGPTHASNGTDPIPTATTSVAGLMAAADKTKLDNTPAIRRGVFTWSPSLGSRPRITFPTAFPAGTTVGVVFSANHPSGAAAEVFRAIAVDVNGFQIMRTSDTTPTEVFTVAWIAFAA